MFFDGAHDSKKKVSLGGKNRGKTQESKQDFLERTKREREDRELARRREKAATNIQRFVRGKELLTQLRNGERVGWDEGLETMAKQWAANSSAAAVSADAGEKLNNLLMRFLFFYRDWFADDGVKLSKLAMWLVTGRLSSSAGPPGIPLLVRMWCAKDAAESKVGRRRVLRLCLISLQRLAKGAGLRIRVEDGKYSVEVVSTVLKPEEDLSRAEMHAMDAGLLLRLCDAGCWNVGDGQNCRLELIEELVKSGLMQVVRKHLDLADSPIPVSATQQKLQQMQVQLQLMLCGLVVQALSSGSAIACEKFFRHLFTRPLLFQRLSKSARQVLEFKNLWDVSLTTLASGDCKVLRQIITESDGNTDAAAGILGNLVDMSAGSLASASISATRNFAACASLLLEKVRRTAQLVTSEEEEEAGDAMDIDSEAGAQVQRVEIEVETAAGRATMQHVRVQKADPIAALGGGDLGALGAAAAAGTRRKRLPASLAVIREHIAAICNREYVLKLLDIIHRVTAPAAGGGTAAIDDQATVAVVASLILQLTDFLPELKSDVLNTLAFKPSVLINLWDWVRSATPAKAGEAPAADPALVTLFCLIYNYLLMTVDNSEFYERQYPFTLAQVRNMVQFVKATIIPMYWDTPRLTEAQQLLRSAGSALLSSLAERNCYCEFVPAEEWIAPLRYIAAVINELDGLVAARLADPDRLDSGGLDPRHRVVLERVPFLLPFTLRVRVLRHLIASDRRTVVDTPLHGIRCTVQRARVVEDSFHALNKYGAELKQTIQITFVSREGLTEAGIDGGGLFKEFVNTLCSQAFNPHYGLFCTTAEGLLFPNPQAETAHPWQDINHLKLFEFLGRIVGKAIYEGILIELRLASFFLRRMLGQALHFDDLKSLDPDLHRNLLFVRSYEGDFEDLALNFVVVEDHFGEARTRELLPGGASMPVTRDNVHRYKHLVSDYWLNRRIRSQSEAFMRGLKDLIRPEWIRAFSPAELQVLVAGARQPVDLADLRANCQYGGGYADDHPTIQLFWSVCEELSHEEREALLMFATSCSRPPLLGFRELHPSFCIHKTAHTAEEADSRLPTASTCMNLLKLPCYSNAADLKDRLLYAIKAGAGFELS